MEDSILLSGVDLALLLLTTLVDGFVVYLFVLEGLFRSFLFLSLYFLLSVTIGIAWWVAVFQFEFPSLGGVYFFDIADALASVFLFLSVIELSLRIRRTGMRRSKIKMWAGAVLLAMACFGFASQIDGGMTMHFLADSSESVLWMCGFAVVLLWVWTLLKNPVDGIAARFVNVLAVYFLLFFLFHEAREIASSSAALNNLASMMSAWLPLGCGFALVSQEQT